MKIIFCDNSLRELINFRGEIINDYAKSGHDVVLIAPVNMDYNPSYSNISLIPIRMSRSGMNPIKDLTYMFSLLKIYKEENPDYIFHYTIKPNIYGSIAAFLCNIPSTAMIAGLGYVFSARGLKARAGRTLYKLAMKFPQHILVLNDYNRQLILKNGLGTTSQVILLKGGEGVNLQLFTN